MKVCILALNASTGNNQSHSDRRNNDCCLEGRLRVRELDLPLVSANTMHAVKADVMHSNVTLCKLVKDRYVPYALESTFPLPAIPVSPISP